MSSTDPNGNASSSVPAARNDVFYWIGLALIGAAAVSGLIKPLLTLARYVVLDPNEGWNAFFAEIAMRGGELYPGPSGSPILNNYPPLSFYIVGAVGRLIGDNIFAGRAVSLASILIVAGNVSLWLRASGSTKRVAWVGAGVLAAFAVTYGRSYAGMNDPQWLAHALMTTGLVVIWRGNASTRAILLGSVLMLAGGWTKHLLISMPIATTWWLVRRSKSAAVTWIGGSALLLAATGMLVWWLYGAAFFQNLVFAREYSWHEAIKDSGAAVKCFGPIVVLSLLLLRHARRSERSEFAAVYLIATALVAATASGGVGVDINKYFDFMIAASMCAALELESLWAKRLPAPLGAFEFGPSLTLLLGIYLSAYAASLVPGALRDMRNLDALEEQTLTATRFIATAGHGHAACDSPELCYWGKSEFMLDAFDFGQRLKLGKEPLTLCASVFDGRQIQLLQLDPNEGGGSMFLPPFCNTVIQQNYRPVFSSTLGVILAPSP
jgi:hypothetical protein